MRSCRPKALFTLLFAALGSCAQVPPPARPAETPCEPGAAVACLCTDDTEGTQACEDGILGDCICALTDAGGDAVSSTDAAPVEIAPVTDAVVAADGFVADASVPDVDAEASDLPAPADVADVTLPPEDVPVVPDVLLPADVPENPDPGPGPDTPADTGGPDTQGDAPAPDGGSTFCAGSPDGTACKLGKCVLAACKAGQCVETGPYLCDDKNPCTDDSCDPGAGCLFAANAKGCDDNDPCTQGDSCADKVCKPGASQCKCKTDADCPVEAPCAGQPFCDTSAAPYACKVKPGTAVNCDDGNTCTADKCSVVTGQCTFAVTSMPCDDKDFCSEGDTCTAGICKPGSPKVCEDDNACTSNSCDPKGQKCNFPPVAGGTPCDDKVFCTVGEICGNGTCSGGKANKCDDGDPCTTDSCAGNGCVHKPDASASKCDDGKACTVNDACGVAGCAGTPKPCDDGEACTTDKCLEIDAGLCKHAPVAGCGTPCFSMDDCTAPLACAGSQKCVATADKVSAVFRVITPGKFSAWAIAAIDAPGTPIPDGVYSGTIKLSGFKSVFVPFNGPIKNGIVVLPPQTGNTTELGVNQITSVTVSVNFGSKMSDEANLAGLALQPYTCVIASPGSPGPACDDKNPCTAEGCDIKGCTHTAQTGTACDDGNACAVDDKCQTGACMPGKPAVDCDDKNPCTVDTCNPATLACSHDAAALDKKPCEDGDLCTSGDVCAIGVCKPGTAKVCTDAKPCTADTCIKTTGNCDFAGAPLDGQSCDDGQPCLVGDKCAAGECVPGQTAKCNDSNDCTADGCDGTGKCTNTVLPTGVCNDGDPCTFAGFCLAGQCTGVGKSKCDDANPCTSDSCDPKKGCQHPVATGACDDGNLCTLAEICQGGHCVGTNNTLCKDGTPCTTDSCDPKTGKCVFTPLDGQPCDDGNPCTTWDTCAGGGCGGSDRYIDSTTACCFNGETNWQPRNFVALFPKANGQLLAVGTLLNISRIFLQPLAPPHFAPPYSWQGNQDVVLTPVARAMGAIETADGGMVVYGNDGGKTAQLFVLDPKYKLTATKNYHTDSGPFVPNAHVRTMAMRADGKGLMGFAYAKNKIKSYLIKTNEAFDATSVEPFGPDNSIVNTVRLRPNGAFVGCGAADTNVYKGAKGYFFTFDANGNGLKEQTFSFGSCADVEPGTDGYFYFTASNMMGRLTSDLTPDWTIPIYAGNNVVITQDLEMLGVGDGKFVRATLSGTLLANRALGNIDGVVRDLGDGRWLHKTSTGAWRTLISDRFGNTTCGVCNGAPAQCADGDTCTIDDCTHPAGCQHGDITKPIDNCDPTDQCQGKTCDDKNPCTANVCDKLSGACQFPATTQKCDDGSACTTDDSCGVDATGKPSCTGIPKPCNDSNPCTSDLCDPAKGCAFLSLPVGAACTDDNLCTDKDTCDAQGKCTGGKPATCDDGASCTVDKCDPVKGCVNTPPAAHPCDTLCGKPPVYCSCSADCLKNGTCCQFDGKSTGPTCAGSTCGQCGGTAGAGKCSKLGSACATHADCDDGKPGTIDQCDPLRGCTFVTQEGSGCSNGANCIASGTWIGGNCVGSIGVDCNDIHGCTIDFCQPGSGCHHRDACDDGNPCTTDSCTPPFPGSQGFCGHKPMAAGAACSDGWSCTVAGTCDAAGKCAGMQSATPFACTGCGAGKDDLVISADQTLSGTIEVQNFEIKPGVKVTAGGTKPLIIKATRKIRIQGILDLSGKPGASVSSCCNNAAGGAGGGGGGGAGGTGGLGAGAAGTGTGAGGGGCSATNAAGGGGGGHGQKGVAGKPGPSSTCALVGAAGNTYNDDQLAQGAMPGSGGGAGGYGKGVPAAGGAGGGGGGALQLVAPQIIVSAGAVVDARGGAGGEAAGNLTAGGGGGGSGGTIWLRGRDIQIAGQVTADGGAGGASVAGAGGAGGTGRVRVDAVLPVQGTTTPTFVAGSVADLGIPPASSCQPKCGDGKCEWGETTKTCAADCTGKGDGGACVTDGDCLSDDPCVAGRCHGSAGCSFTAAADGLICGLKGEFCVAGQCVCTGVSTFVGGMADRTFGVPACAVWAKVDLFGGAGGHTNWTDTYLPQLGGRGAHVAATLPIPASNKTITLKGGERGGDATIIGGTVGPGAGGGGGMFAWIGGQSLVAGGGGGAHRYAPGGAGFDTEKPFASGSGGPPNAGAGGTSCSNWCGGGGGGMNGAGTSSTTWSVAGGGGAAGGGPGGGGGNCGQGCAGGTVGGGGKGGGGAGGNGGGGGGGYTGGGGGNTTGTGSSGGGSFVAGTATQKSLVSGQRAGQGAAVVRWCGPPAGCLAADCAAKSLSACDVPFCGDGLCAGSEDTNNCPFDCLNHIAAKGCGDGVCGPQENVYVCPWDCDAPASPACGDGVCAWGESPATCGADCGAGPDACGNKLCQDGEGACTKDCTAPTKTCGDGVCDAGEDSAGCGADCCGSALVAANFDSGEMPFGSGSSSQTVIWQQSWGVQSRSWYGGAYLGDLKRKTYDANGARVQSALYLPSVTPVGGQATRLDLWLWMDTEASDTYDLLRIVAYVANQKAPKIIWQSNAKTARKQWVNVTYDLTAWAQVPISIRVEFDTVDGLANTGVGVVLDDVRILTGCPQQIVCGNAKCETGENPSNCSSDCKVIVICGDGLCDATESASQCPTDCKGAYCGNAKCEAGETPTNCKSDCIYVPACGDAKCEAGEDYKSCPADCKAPVCGNGACETGEDHLSCAADCKTPPPPPGHACNTLCGGISAWGCACDADCTFYGDCCNSAGTKKAGYSCAGSTCSLCN